VIEFNLFISINQLIMKAFNTNILRFAILLFCILNLNNLFAQTVSIQASTISTSVCYGASVTFTASTSSISSPTYQWVFNNVNIPGATNSTYTTTTNITDVVSVIVNGTYSKTIYLSEYYACGLDRQGRQIPTSSDTLVSQNGWINQGTGLNDKGRRFSYKVNVTTDGIILNLDSRNINSYRSVVPGTWYDLTTNHYNGTINGNVSYSTDNGGALNFAGSYTGSAGNLDGSVVGDYVSLPTAYYFTGGSFTIQSWVYVTAFQDKWERIVDFGNTSGGGTSEVLVTTNADNRHSPGMQIGSSGPLYSGNRNELSTNQWHFVAVTFDYTSGATGTAKVYLDDVLLATGPQNVPTNVSRTRNYIGRSNWWDSGARDPDFKGVLVHYKFIIKHYQLRNYIPII
jgi:hypothetical protein